MELKEPNESKKSNRAKQAELKDSILAMFKKNGGEPIKLDFKDPFVGIEIHCFELLEKGEQAYKLWIKDKGENVAFWGALNISELTTHLLEAPKLVLSRRETIHNWQNYYTTNLEGRTQEQWDLAKRVEWKILNGRDFEQDVKDAAVSLQVPERVVIDAWKFVCSLYQYRSGTKEISSKLISDADARKIEKSSEENDNNIFGGVYSSNYDKEFLREHPNKVLRDRNDVYAEFDNAMHRFVVQNVPSSLIDYPGVDSKRSYAVLYYPNTHFSGKTYTLEAKTPYYRLELPLAQVQKGGNGNFDLILDDRKDYFLGNSWQRKAGITSAYHIQTRIEQYCTALVTNSKIPHPPVSLIGIDRDDLHKVELKDKTVAYVKVPYSKSSDGFGIIYRDVDCISVGNHGMVLKIGDVCTVHYYDADRRRLRKRMHDKGVPAEDIKASFEQFEENKKLLIRQMGGYIDDLSIDLIKDDLENDDIRNDDQWSL